MAAAAQVASEERLTGGKFYGSVVNKQVVGGATSYGAPANPPAQASRAFPRAGIIFCLVFGGDYAEKYGRRDVQFRPFTFAYRPAGVPHQDEVGPRGARMFGIEVERGWQRNVKLGSADLGFAYDFEDGTAIAGS